jgi:hypothetical protein
MQVHRHRAYQTTACLRAGLRSLYKWLFVLVHQQQLSVPFILLYGSHNRASNASHVLHNCARQIEQLIKVGAISIHSTATRADIDALAAVVHHVGVVPSCFGLPVLSPAMACGSNPTCTCFFAACRHHGLLCQDVSAFCPDQQQGMHR